MAQDPVSGVYDPHRDARAPADAGDGAAVPTLGQIDGRTDAPQGSAQHAGGGRTGRHGWRARLRDGVIGMVALSVILSVGALAASALLSNAPSAEAQGGQAEPLPVPVMTVHLQTDYAVQRRFAGRIAAARSTDAAFERGGLVVDVLADDGDRVAAGAVLARLDTAALVTERQRLLAERDRLDARIALAERTAARQRNLSTQGHSSAQRFDEARFEVDAVAAERRALEAAIAALDVDLRKSALRAPFDARVALRRVDEGTVISAGQTVLRLLEDTAPEARVGVPAATAATLQPGQSYAIAVGGETVEGRLRTLLPDLDTRTQTVTAVFDLTPAERANANAGATTPLPVALRRGSIVQLLLDERVSDRGVWVPVAALTEGVRGLWTVYAVPPAPDGADPVVVRDSVEILHVTEDRAYVRGTLGDGTRIITSGLHRVVPGQRVMPVDVEGEETIGAPLAALVPPRG